jgi:hypothetical protein
VSNLDLSKEFAGKRALITGGSRGIGAAAAQRLIDGGAKVVVTARNKHAETPKDAIFISGDIRTKEGADAIGKATLKELGGLDILVNSVGAARVHLPNAEAIPDDEWVDSLNINFLATLRVTNSVLQALKESKSGAIVNVSSGGRLSYGGPLLHYGAAKAALNTYTEGLVFLDRPAPGPRRQGGRTRGGDRVPRFSARVLRHGTQHLRQRRLGRTRSMRSKRRRPARLGAAAHPSNRGMPRRPN